MMKERKKLVFMISVAFVWGAMCMTGCGGNAQTKTETQVWTESWTQQETWTHTCLLYTSKLSGGSAMSWAKLLFWYCTRSTMRRSIPIISAPLRMGKQQNSERQRRLSRAKLYPRYIRWILRSWKLRESPSAFIIDSVSRKKAEA